uniref:Saposin B-type domain-containing protein n=1 Tax=Steinernema glaseri TaxID=37863 RepID=A0A1I7Z331_9BILA
MRLWTGAFFLLVVLLLTTSVQSKGKSKEEKENEKKWNTIICKSCQTAVKGFQFLYGKKPTQDYTIQALSFVCRTVLQEDAPVCRALRGHYRDQFIYVLRELVVKPYQICGLIADNCGKMQNPFDVKWAIKFPKRSKPKRNLSMCKSKL